MSNWVKLSGGLYLFGQDGVNRLEDYVHHLSNGELSVYKTSLYHNTSQITVVRETIDEIEEKLNERK